MDRTIDPSRRYGHLKFPQYGPNARSVGRRSSVGRSVGRQSVGHQYILLLTLISYTPLRCVRNVGREEYKLAKCPNFAIAWKLSKYPNFYDICPKKIFSPFLGRGARAHLPPRLNAYGDSVVRTTSIVNGKSWSLTPLTLHEPLTRSSPSMTCMITSWISSTKKKVGLIPIYAKYTPLCSDVY